MSKATPLLDAHKGLGARLTEFGGWDMPLQYEGVVSEHKTVRGSTGLFDVTHLGKLRVSGPQAESALQHALTADVSALEPGRASYALVLTDEGGVVDDVFVYRLSATEWLVVPNASNVEAVAEKIRESGGEPVDAWDSWAILALQGPTSYDVFEDVWPESGAPGLSLHSFSVMDCFGEEAMIARTGYTGERGFELYVPFAVSVQAFHALLAAGAKPVGLGARDTLRLEMGYALYGHELALDINPLEAGLGWVLAWDTDFRGRSALAEIKEKGPARRTFGIQCRDRGVPRQGYDVYRGDEHIATLTSGNFSPTLETGIGIALGPRESVPQPGEQVEIDARGRRIVGDIVKPPFINS